jgi:hypothetical protein
VAGQQLVALYLLSEGKVGVREEVEKRNGLLLPSESKGKEGGGKSQR